jgi:hypothetical protein
LDVVQARLHYCVGPVVRAWLLAHPITPSFYLSSAHFLVTLHIRFGIPHLTIFHISRCQFGHTIDDLGTHLLCCPCRIKHIATHDTLRNTIEVIALESGTHIQRQVSHLFPHHTQRRVDIVIIRNNFCTLADIVIVDMTCTNLVYRVSTTTTHVATVAAQDKAQSCIEQALGDDFIPLAIETYSCFHPRFDSFLIFCVHAYITRHQHTSLVLLMLIYHNSQQVLIALHHARIITIL